MLLLRKLINKLKIKNSEISNYENISFYASVSNCNFEKSVTVSKYAELHDTEIGSFTSVGRNSKISNSEIGRFCAISWNVTINAISHPLDRLTTSAFPYVAYLGFVKINSNSNFKKKVVIGSDVWIGANVIIMPGVKIGDGAVIGAGSVVTKDISPYTIVAGVPAKKIRQRFKEDIVDKLCLLRWWDLDASTIKENVNLWQLPVDDNLTDILQNLKEKNV